ncbi:hypothetical protein MA16_Dca023704 [Dendrobium catenatum]|uniref:Uncharacterized protein n=2 Tax=Dendrobium catenatum TaxID=906689 RepID=A0A2I0VYX4_9ASPA|nr:hypothetical protein MA16_Dca023704 [Dendrobium catenatum]
MAMRCSKLVFPLSLPSSSASKQSPPTMQLAEESMAKVTSEMPEEEELFQAVEENMEFEDQAVMEFEGLQDFDSWVFNDEEEDYLPDDDQMQMLTSLFGMGGGF